MNPGGVVVVGVHLVVVGVRRWVHVSVHTLVVIPTVTVVVVEVHEVVYLGDIIHIVCGRGGDIGAVDHVDVINYLTRIRDIPIFESVILEKSYVALEGTNIKNFVINIDVYQNLMNAQNLQDELESMEN